jgi:hypothetical protein
MYNYDTVSQAVNGLKSRGYTIDFNIEYDAIVCKSGRCHPEDFEITEIYRFEGNTDPADEAIVYAIESKKGLKGVMVNGYGVSSDALSDSMIKKLSIHLH